MIDQENSTFEHSIRKDDLYKIYEKFCQINKVLSEEKETFGKQLKKIIGKDRLDDTQREPTKDPITGKRIYVYKGIKVKPEWLDESRREKQASLLTRTEDEESEELPSDTTTGNNSSEKKGVWAVWAKS